MMFDCELRDRGRARIAIFGGPIGPEPDVGSARDLGIERGVHGKFVKMPALLVDVSIEIGRAAKPAKTRLREANFKALTRSYSTTPRRGELAFRVPHRR